MKWTISQDNANGIRNPWVWGMVLFLLVFLSVNAVFIYLAFSSPPNLVVDNYYERGKQYMMTREKIDQEKQLGWTGTVIAPGNTRVNQLQQYEAIINGKNAAGLLLDSVVLYAYRPSNSREDFSVPMHKTATGSYIADVSFHLPGIWDLIVEAKQGEQKFVITRRVNIAP